jgi:hypothetical protein
MEVVAVLVGWGWPRGAGRLVKVLHVDTVRRLSQKC